MASASQLVGAINSLRSALSSRQSLDRSIAAQDAADWKDWTDVSPSQSSSSPPLTANKLGKGARSGGRGGKGAGPGTSLNKRDLKIKPPSTRIPSSVPRNFMSSVTYDLVKVRSTSTTSTSTVVENNFAFALNNHPQYSSWATLFDQWCIPMASVSFYNPQAPGSTSSEIELHTAIDFDNSTSIGTLAAIDAYDTCQVVILGPGNKSSHTRSVKPCLKSNAGAQNNAALLRQWCDCATPGTSWYGIRSIVNSTTTAMTFTLEATVWYGFRSRI